MVATLTFGRHRGRRVADVPRGYLKFLLGLDDLDAWLREEVKAELRGRGERYVSAALVLADLEELLTARISEDRRLDHATAGIVSDHLLEAFEELRARHNVGACTELVLAPRQREG
jgi:hypothetical protein